MCVCPTKLCILVSRHNTSTKKVVNTFYQMKKHLSKQLPTLICIPLVLSSCLECSFFPCLHTCFLCSILSSPKARAHGMIFWNSAISPVRRQVPPPEDHRDGPLSEPQSLSTYYEHRWGSPCRRHFSFTSDASLYIPLSVHLADGSLHLSSNFNLERRHA